MFHMNEQLVRKAPELLNLSLSPILGTGEMADLTRHFDWKGTSLGPVESWPDSLLITVNVLLASGHPMFLWWGPELIQFYNDAYSRSIRQDKHPKALGQRGKECWPEIWPIIGPQIESVMTEGKSTWNVNQLVPIYRSEKLEEVFWTYGYSPVRDENGTVQGVLVVCSETTEQVLSDRRLRTLLGINRTSYAAQSQEPFPESLLRFSAHLIDTLGANQADIPFAALYLTVNGTTKLAGSMGAADKPFDKPESWPLEAVIQSNTAMLVGLEYHSGDLVCPLWPEPVKRGYLVPLRISESSMDGVLVFGISPRLPFDERYETFFQLVGSRIAGLLEIESRHQERMHERVQAAQDLERKVSERTEALQAEVADRKRAEASLGVLTGQLLRAQDEERRHIARELHDSAGQMLAALGMNLGAIQQAAAGQSGDLIEAAGEARSLVEEILREIRTLSYLLHPPLLEEAGLDSAVKWYAQGFSERSKIKVDLELEANEVRLPGDVELVIFRVIQESLTNIHRHSGSDSAKIRITRSETHVEVRVSDKGKGIPLGTQRALKTAKAGVGVRGMQERVRQLGGQLEITSSETGTDVTVVLPIQMVEEPS